MEKVGLKIETEVGTEVETEVEEKVGKTEIETKKGTEEKDPEKDPKKKVLGINLEDPDQEVTQKTIITGTKKLQNRPQKDPQKDPDPEQDPGQDHHPLENPIPECHIEDEILDRIHVNSVVAKINQNVIILDQDRGHLLNAKNMIKRVNTGGIIILGAGVVVEVLRVKIERRILEKMLRIN